MKLQDLQTDDGRAVRFGILPFGSSLPAEGGLYAIFAGEQLLYIGKADDLDGRTGAGLAGHEKGVLFEVLGASHVGYAPIGSQAARDVLEASLIRFNRPPLNNQHNPAGPSRSNGLLGGMFEV